MSAVSTAFSKNGFLAKAINGFSPRQEQLEMALAVENTIQQKHSLIVEAGTGTGKTFAYLIPALLANKVAAEQDLGQKKIIISTGTKNLQEQLFHKDLPLIRKAIISHAQVALLKGRANYLCLYRLDQYQQTRGQLDATALADFVEVRKWATTTQSGDIGELVNVSENASIFPHITSTLDNCLSKECPNIEACYLVKAREKAIEADLVVVNHHLFFADMALKDTGFGELIPKAEVMIFDEAHQLPDIACEYFGEVFSSKQLVDLCNDVQTIYRTELTDAKQLGLAAEKLAKTSQEFRLLFAYDPERGNWREKYQQRRIKQAFDDIKTDLYFLYQVLNVCISRSKGVGNCFDRAANLLNKHDIIADVDAAAVSLWYETTPRSVVLHKTPLSVAKKFADYVKDSNASWVFTSATLTVDGRFQHFSQQLGIEHSNQLLLDSPFDYQQQSQLIIPRYLPATHHKNRAQALAQLAIPLIEASAGACFMLFTSYRVMNQVAELLVESIDNNILVQGQMAKRKLLDNFVEDNNAILLATASFWEGVDVRGNNLTCVIIDKLPFAAPDDPLLQARSEDMRQQGKDPFTYIQLPQAVITLKQGVGRLIRDVADKGVLVICDDRLVNRPYGEVFLKSLPDMKRSRNIEKAVEFLINIV